MRRKDREMSEEFALRIIDKSIYANLTTIDSEGLPYTIPISVAREGKSVYMHSAKEGTKIDNIKNNNFAIMTFVGDTKIPDPITESEYKKAVEEGKAGKYLLSKKFTTEFESAVARGKISIVESDEEKIKGLRLISEKYTPENMPYFDNAIKVSLNIVNVIRFDIESIKGKRKKFDKNGEEMKWQRME
ncbi:MAG: pyridoxamine 5'-phosphate oxidase family protein [Andreesenia angusta]|nr:pyridoxamine 5'-phosphate oxidase family protein [Andreesenia angusta]